MKVVASVLDPEQMLQVTDGDLELIQEIIEVFLEDTPERIERVEQALAEGNAELVKREAHSIKGAAASMGCVELREIAWEMEKDPRDVKVGTSESRLDALREAFNRLETELRHFDWEATGPSRPTTACITKSSTSPRKSGYLPTSPAG